MLKNVYDKFINSINKACSIALGISMLALFLVLLLQIISRFVMFLQLTWSQDMITFLLVCCTFLGVGSATGMGKQIRLEFFVDLFPKRVSALFLIAADLVSIVFVSVVAYQAIQLSGDNMYVHLGTSLVSVGIYYAVVAFGCITMALNFINLIIKNLYVLIGKETTE